MSEHSPDEKTPKQGACSAINTMVEHENKRRQMRLKHKPHRQAAIAAWPLMVANLALDMKRLLDAQRYAPPSDLTKQASEALDYMEKQIRESFIQQFGFDMVGAGPDVEVGEIIPIGGGLGTTTFKYDLALDDPPKSEGEIKPCMKKKL